ncbi:MAG: RNA polymerase sigma factor [Oscillospiraceae bacterium]
MENNAYKRFLDGDNSALLDIIREYKNGLTMYLNSYVHDLNLADELCCETFVRLAYKKPKFCEGSSFKTFLYGIGRNVALVYIRRNKKRISEPLDKFSQMTDAVNLEEELLIKERNAQLYKSIGNLKHEYAQALWLMYFEDLSVKEIAEIMKKSLSAVKVLLHRARQALKEELNKEGFEYENC